MPVFAEMVTFDSIHVGNWRLRQTPDCSGGWTVNCGHIADGDIPVDGRAVRNWLGFFGCWIFGRIPLWIPVDDVDWILHCGHREVFIGEILQQPASLARPS